MKISSTRKKKTRKNTLKIIIAFGIVLALIATIIYVAWTYKRSSPSIIVEGNTIEDIYKYIKPSEYNQNTLVIFDIDNTLIYPGEKVIGSEQWFYSMVSKYESQGMTTQEAINTILPQSFSLLEYLPMELIEPATASVITTLQARNIATIALTARSLDLTYRTVDQLAQLGIHFNGVGPAQCPIVYGEGKPALYMEGILFCGNHAKGDVLVDWMKQIEYHPKKIIFIDDKEKNLVGVDQKLPKDHYQFIGIRYTYLDTHKSKVHQDQVERELKEFSQQYPDARPLTEMPAE